MTRGKFITVEGIEGVGKSTNIDSLVRMLEGQGLTVITTREPGGTPMAERIRNMLLEHGDEPLPDIAELLLFFASRSLHIQNTIKPALRDGTWVVCDRFTDASRAYQGYARGQDLDRIEALAEWVHDGLQPDLTILLDAPAEIGMNRAADRGAADRMEIEAKDFYQRARDGYLALAAAEPERFVVVDATGSLAEVQDSVMQAIQPLLNDN